MKYLQKISSSGLIWIGVSILVLFLDRATKLLAVTHLAYQQPLEVLPFFNLTLAFNTGAAFSFLHSASGWQNWFLGSLAAVVTVCVLIWLSRLPRNAYWMNVALCLVIGGALGNAWDRLLFGYVIDFISLHLGTWYFAIFNVADSAICVGAFMIVLYWTWQELLSKKQ